ncbi:MAG: YjjG family noncanonical pyrimidine nucleotidase [Oscillospiraceae bacterium]|nr:YjjG family noncanonical pyrimidine nucleotidase [Oscillospiraceae bacterium]
MKYTTLLFDSDDTLLDFAAAEMQALKVTFASFAPDVGSEITAKYKEINRSLWASYERGEIARDDIFSRRFTETFAHFGVTLPDIDIADFYQTKLSECHELLDGTADVLEALCGKFNMHIITNGKKSTQQRRLFDAGIEKYFGKFFISEDMGTQKPSAKFFDIVFDELCISRDEALIIGDSYSSDISGGINAHVDTCWLNPKCLKPTGDAPTFEIKHLRELLEILL